MATLAFIPLTVFAALGLGLFIGPAMRNRPVLAVVICLLIGAWCALCWVDTALFAVKLVRV